MVGWRAGGEVQRDRMSTHKKFQISMTINCLSFHTLTFHVTRPLSNHVQTLENISHIRKR